MDHFIGLDVSVRETSVCVVDESGKILKEAKVPTEPEAIASLIAKGGYACWWKPEWRLWSAALSIPAVHLLPVSIAVWPIGAVQWLGRRCRKRPWVGSDLPASANESVVGPEMAM